MGKLAVAVVTAGGDDDDAGVISSIIMFTGVFVGSVSGAAFVTIAVLVAVGKDIKVNVGNVGDTCGLGDSVALGVEVGVDNVATTVTTT